MAAVRGVVLLLAAFHAAALEPQQLDAARRVEANVERAAERARSQVSERVAAAQKQLQTAQSEYQIAKRAAARALELAKASLSPAKLCDRFHPWIAARHAPHRRKRRV